MERNRKFCVTRNRTLDIDIIGDVQYLGVNEWREKSGLVIFFKDPAREALTLFGDEPDVAWRNYRIAAGLTPGDQDESNERRTENN